LARGRDLMARAEKLKQAAGIVRLAGAIFMAGGIVLLILGFYRNLGRLETAATLEELGRAIYGIILVPLALIIVGIVFLEAARVLARAARRAETELREEVLGLIEVYGRIRLEDLAAKLGLPQDEVVSLLARYAREGVFGGRIGEDGYVYSAREPALPVPIVAGAAGEESVEPGGGGTVVVEQPPEPQGGQPTATVEQPPGEVPEEVRRQLEELERAYREGLISREAYERARRELEESMSGRRL